MTDVEQIIEIVNATDELIRRAAWIFIIGISLCVVHGWSKPEKDND